MITDKKSYKYYLAEDKKALGAKTRYPLFNTNCMIWLTDPLLEVSEIVT